MEKFELKKNLRSNDVSLSQTAGLADKRLLIFSSKQLKKDKHFDKCNKFEFNPEKYMKEINSDLKDQEMQEKRTKENKSVKFEKQLEDTMALITQRLEQIETTLNDFMQDYKKLSQAYIQSLERINEMQQKQIQSCLDMIVEKNKGESKE